MDASRSCVLIIPYRQTASLDLIFLGSSSSVCVLGFIEFSFGENRFLIIHWSMVNSFRTTSPFLLLSIGLLSVVSLNYSATHVSVPCAYMLTMCRSILTTTNTIADTNISTDSLRFIPYIYSPAVRQSTTTILFFCSESDFSHLSLSLYHLHAKHSLPCKLHDCLRIYLYNPFLLNLVSFQITLSFFLIISISLFFHSIITMFSSVNLFLFFFTPF